MSLREKAKMDPALSPWLRNEAGVVGMGHWMGAVAIDPFDPDHMMYGTGETMWATHEARRAGHGVRWTVGAEGIEETAVISLLSPLSGPGAVCRAGGYRVLPGGGCRGACDGTAAALELR